MQRCSLNNAWTMLLSRFKNTCWMLMSIVRSIVVWCWQRTIVVTMLLEHELTTVDEKSLLIVVNNDWTMVVEREQLWTMIVDNSCWQGAAQHCWTVCSTTLQQVVDNIDQVVHFCACRNTSCFSVQYVEQCSWKYSFYFIIKTKHINSIKGYMTKHKCCCQYYITQDCC